MIDIYTEKIDSKDWIIKNDLFFNLNTSNEEMSDNEVALIKQWYFKGGVIYYELCSSVYIQYFFPEFIG